MTNIPTTAEINSRIKAEIEAEFGVTIPSWGRNVLRVLSWVLAGVFKVIYLYLGKVQKNMFPDTAEPEAQGGTLERDGRIRLGRDPFPATQGQYEVSITGTIGATIPARTVWVGNDDSLSPGKNFIIDNAFTLTASPDTVTLRALEAGDASRLAVGDGLTCTQPVSNVNEAAIVTAETVEPQEAEDIEDYRVKVLDSYRIESQGGAKGDYRLWAADAQGVQRVYPYAVSGQTAEINLYVEATIDDSSDGHGTPTSDILDDVAAVIEQDPDTTLALEERTRRPMGVFEVHVLPVTPLAVDITITGYQGITDALKATILEAMEEAFAVLRPYVDGVDVPSTKNDVLNNNRIIFIIQDAVPNSIFSSVAFEVDGNAETSYVFAGGEIPYVNTITYA